jgi:hypothetical protein
VNDDRWDDALDPVTGRAMYFDRAGQPISTRRWSELRWQGVDADGKFGPGSYLRVAADEVGRYWVSTVWLGLDHGFGFGRGAPVIFETMIFVHDGGDDEPYQNACERYCTEAEAVEGHRRTVANLVAGRVPWFLVGEVDDE